MAKAKKNEIVVKEEKVVTPKIDLTEIKNELTDYVDKEIKVCFNDEVKRINNKLVREKNKKVIVRDIIILILLAVIGFLVYLLYSVNYFDKFFKKSSETPVVIDKPTNEEVVTTEPEDRGPTLSELKEEFGFLLDKIEIDETSTYILDYYNGNLTDELRNYLALNMLEFNNLVVEDDCNIIDKDVFESAYYKLFSKEVVYTGFDYNSNKVKYLNKLASFVTTSVLKKIDSNIKREIINIEVEEENIKITTVEGVVVNDRLYNVLTNDEVKKYKKDNIANYQDKLNTVTYTFHNSTLESISKN